MDTRYIQAILGHARLESFQIYTRVSIQALKALHTATHPGRPPRTGARIGEEHPEPATPRSISDSLFGAGDEDH